MTIKFDKEKVAVINPVDVVKIKKNHIKDCNLQFLVFP